MSSDRQDSAAGSGAGGEAALAALLREERRFDPPADLAERAVAPAAVY